MYKYDQQISVQNFAMNFKASSEKTAENSWGLLLCCTRYTLNLTLQ